MSPPFDLRDLEVLTFGRSSVDLYPEQHNVPLADVSTFRKSIGGSPTNVAVAAARLGRRAAVINRVGDDAFGAFIRQGLRDFGVHDGFVTTDAVLLTPVVFCELMPPEEPSLYFYREPRGPEMNISVDDMPMDAIRSAPLFWLTGSRFAEEPSRSAAMAALAARGRAKHTVIDLDYRPMFWSSAEEASEHIPAAIEHCTGAVGNRDECEIAVGTRDPDEAADLVVMKEALLKNMVHLAEAPLAVRCLRWFPEFLRDPIVHYALARALRPTTVTCQVMTLSQFVNDHGIDRIDLLKIDAEKAELEIFRGIETIDWRKIRQVVVEVHDLSDRLDTMTTLLHEHGLNKIVVEQPPTLASSNIYNVFASRG